MGSPAPDPARAVAASGPVPQRGRRGTHRRPSRSSLVIVVSVVALMLAAVGIGNFAVAGGGSRALLHPVDLSPSPTVDPSEPADGSGPDQGDGPTGQASPPEVPSRFPDASTTGVPDGVQLRESGGFDVVEDGAVIENLLIVDGSIEVWANDVTIRNVRVTNRDQELLWGILQREEYSGLVVEDSEVYGGGDAHLAAGITNHGGMITIQRVEIHTVSDGVSTETGLLQDSYLHSPIHVEGDHNDMFQANGGPVDGQTLEIRNNTIVNNLSQTGAISLFDSVRDVQGVVVEGNYLAGGGYTLYGGGWIEDGANPADIVVRDNVFSRQFFPDGGYYGPVAHFDPTAPGNEWSGNVWEDGSPVEP